MSFIFGGGGGQTQTGSQGVTQREAPEIEARKLSLYDPASKLASQPVNLPAMQVAPITGIEQAAIKCYDIFKKLLQKIAIIVSGASSDSTNIVKLLSGNAEPIFFFIFSDFLSPTSILYFFLSAL